MIDQFGSYANIMTLRSHSHYARWLIPDGLPAWETRGTNSSTLSRKAIHSINVLGGSRLWVGFVNFSYGIVFKYAKTDSMQRNLIAVVLVQHFLIQLLYPCSERIKPL